MQGNDKNERFLFRRPLIEFAFIFVYCRANSASQGVRIMLFAMRKFYCIRTESTNILTVFPHHLEKYALLDTSCAMMFLPR